MWEQFDCISINTSNPAETERCSSYFKFLGTDWRCGGLSSHLMNVRRADVIFNKSFRCLRLCSRPDQKKERRNRFLVQRSQRDETPIGFW